MLLKQIKIKKLLQIIIRWQSTNPFCSNIGEKAI